MLKMAAAFKFAVILSQVVTLTLTLSAALFAIATVTSVGTTLIISCRVNRRAFIVRVIIVNTGGQASFGIRYD